MPVVSEELVSSVLFFIGKRGLIASLFFVAYCVINKCLLYLLKTTTDGNQRKLRRLSQSENRSFREKKSNAYR